jgi:hypothetical protein
MDTELVTTLITAGIGAAALIGATVTILTDRGLDIMKILLSVVERLTGRSNRP